MKNYLVAGRTQRTGRPSYPNPRHNPNPSHGLNPNPNPNHRARREFIYPGWAYYAAATTNGLARLTWAVYISPGQKVVQQHVILLLGCIELLRRAQWALLRLEWEQHHRHRKIADAAAKEREAAARAMQHEQLRARRSNDHIYG